MSISVNPNDKWDKATPIIKPGTKPQENKETAVFPVAAQTQKAGQTDLLKVLAQETGVEGEVKKEETKIISSAVTNPFSAAKKDEKSENAEPDALTQDELNKRINEIDAIRTKEHGELQFEEIEKLANLPKSQYTKMQERNLLYNENRGKEQFNAEDIIALSSLSDKDFAKIKDLCAQKGREGKQLSAKTLEKLATGDEKILSRAKKLSFVKERKDNQLSDKAVDFLANLPDNEYENLEKRGLLYIKERGDKQLGGSICAVAKLTDEEYKTAQERGLVTDKEITGFAIAEWAKLSDKEFEFTKNFVHSLGKEHSRLSIQDISNVSKMAVSAPEKWKKIEDSGLIEMIQKGEVNVDAIHSLNKNSDISPELLQDLQTVKDKKSIVPQFSEGTSLEEAFSKTKTGDAVEVGDKMYINDGEKLRSWKMTKEKYLELFPPVQRYTTMQGSVGDCYLVSALDSCMKNPNARADLYKLFSQEGDDVYVKLKGSGKKYQFKDGNLYLGSENKHLSGCKGLQMIEQAYAIEALGVPTEDIEPVEITQNSTHSALMEQIEGGHSSVALAKVLGVEEIGDNSRGIPCFNKSTKLITKEEIEEFETQDNPQPQKQGSTRQLEKYLGKYANDNRYMLQLATIAPENTNAESTLNEDYSLLSQHAYSILGYDGQNKTLKIANPHNSSINFDVPLDEINKYLAQFYMTKIK